MQKWSARDGEEAIRTTNRCVERERSDHGFSCQGVEGVSLEPAPQGGGAETPRTIKQEPVLPDMDKDDEHCLDQRNGTRRHEPASPGIAPSRFEGGGCHQVS